MTFVIIRTYFNMPSNGPDHTRKPDHVSEMEWQIRRWGKFTWLSGDHIVEQAVHEIDIANWMKRGRGSREGQRVGRPPGPYRLR